MDWTLLDVLKITWYLLVNFNTENPGFFGNGQGIVNGTVLRIDESTACLDRVASIRTRIYHKSLTVLNYLR